MNTPYDIHAPIIGKKLFTLALQWSRTGTPGITAATEAAGNLRGRKKRINGSTAKRAAAEATIEAAKAIRAARQARIKARTPYDLFQRTDAAKKRPRLPAGTPAQRLDRFRLQAIAPYLQRWYRFDEAPEIELSNDPARIGVVQNSALNWDYYPKRVRYPKKIVTTTITIPRLWRLRVQKHGLALIAGMVTLDAQPIEGTPEGIRLFAATWLEQGRGYALHTRQGFIALGDASNYHGDSAAQALAGLRRKLKRKADDTAITNLLEKHGLERITRQTPNLMVSIADAKAMGACEYGIQSWCHATGLPYETGQAPLADVYVAYQQRPVAEARAAILHALRRQKTAVLKRVSNQ